MNIEEGFQLEIPEVFVSWGIHRTELRALLDCYGLVYLGHFYMLDCVSLGGLKDKVYFALSKEHLLYEISFYHYDKQPPLELFGTFQEHLEAHFGKPTEIKPSDLENSGGFPSYTWLFTDGRISHYVIDWATLAGRRKGFEEKTNFVNYASLRKKREIPFSRETSINTVLRDDGWLTCPRCEVSFTTRNAGSWTGHSHRGCGQEINPVSGTV